MRACLSSTPDHLGAPETLDFSLEVASSILPVSQARVNRLGDQSIRQVVVGFAPLQSRRISLTSAFRVGDWPIALKIGPLEKSKTLPSSWSRATACPPPHNFSVFNRGT